MTSIALIPPDEPDEIQAQLAVQWRGTPNVVFKVSGPKIYGGLSPVKIAMTDLTIAATVKITMAHLMNELPVVGGLQVTLTEDPTVAYKVAVKAAPGMPKLSLNSIPGLKSAISNAVVNVLRDTIVFPKSVNVMLAGNHTPQTVRSVEDAMRISPVGTLYVTVKHAKGLKNADYIGTSDPYVALALGSRKVPPKIKFNTSSKKDKEKEKDSSPTQPSTHNSIHRTRTVSNDLNPTFDEHFTLPVMSTELQCVWCRVYDDDGGYSAHDLMGTVVLPLAGLPIREEVVGVYPLKSPAELDGAAAKKPRGTVELILKYEPVEEEVGVGDFSGCKSCALTSHEKEIQKHKKMTSFQRQIAKALGISKGNRTFEALRNKLLTDDGSLSSINDADLKVLARHTPTRMDVSNGVPLWAVYPDFCRVAFMNEILLTVWPYAEKAIHKELSLLNGGVLADHLKANAAYAARKAGITRLSNLLGLSTSNLLNIRGILELGQLPPQMEGVRVRKGDADEIVVEWSVKVAGDGYAGCEIGLKGVPLAKCKITAGEGQMLAVIRVRLKPLVPRAPVVAGVSVSFFGETIVDGRLDLKVPLLPHIDILSLPPLRVVKAYALGPVLRKVMCYPTAVHVPILDFDHPAVKVLTSTTSGTERHGLEISIIGARNLDAADSFGTSDPYVVLSLAGEGRYDTRVKKTSVKQRTLTPHWYESFTYVVADAKDAKELFIGVFDSDGKKKFAKVVAPEKVREKINPVKGLHLRSLEATERYMFRATAIPWAKSKGKGKGDTKKKSSLTRTSLDGREGLKSDQKNSPSGSKPKGTSLSGRLKQARELDILQRGLLEPPVLPREETEEEKLKAERKAKKAAQKKKKASSKNLALDTKKNLAAFNPNRVVSDVEACIVAESVQKSNDLLGAALVDFSEVCKPGTTKRLWLKLEGCPGDEKREKELERRISIDNVTPPASPKRGSFSSRASAFGSKSKRNTNPPEIEIELTWRVYDAVKQSMGKSLSGVGIGSNSGRSSGVDRDSGDEQDSGGVPRSLTPPPQSTGSLVGALTVYVSHGVELYKPRSRWGKMSGSKVTPKVILRVGGQSAESSTGRGANPAWREGFDFFGITALDELVLEVVHPGRATNTIRRAKSLSIKKPMDSLSKVVDAVSSPGNKLTKSPSSSKRTKYAENGVTSKNASSQKSYGAELGLGVGDRFMGVATVPLHTVVRSGTSTGSYTLSGVKHGEIHLTLTFRAERF